MSKVSPTVNEVITLQVDNTSGSEPVAASWNFGDNEQGNGVITSHRWTAARDLPYLVAVIATLPDGRERTISVNVTVTETPRFTLTVDTPNGGTISVDGVNCPPTCRVAFEPDTQITLRAQPDATHKIGGWSGACAGRSGDSCDITMNASKTASHRFDPRDPTALLRVRLDGEPVPGAFVDIQAGGAPVRCPPTCSMTLDRGSFVTLRAVPDPHLFRGWSGEPCRERDRLCNFQMITDVELAAFFERVPPEITNLSCGTESGRFTCTVSHLGGVEQIRWFFNGLPRPDADDRGILSGTCTSGLRFDVGVIVSDPRSREEDTEQRAATCA